jgi:ABC-2 type transport system ATP-binding protein
MNDSIVINDLHKNYGEVKALRGVNLTIHAGEIFGLLGANGAGKTTLIKSLVGLLRPTAGTVSVIGLDPQTQKRDLRRQVGYMPQTPVLYEDLSGRDNIKFFGRAHRIADLNEKVDEVLRFVDLLDRADSPVYTYSGGMKQRLSLACAMVHRPRVLLLDEPTTGVDPKLRETFWAYFHHLTEEGTTIVISTHQMDEAIYCDRLAVMREGLVLACDTPRDLLWRGQTTVKVWNGDRIETERMGNYPENLPVFLQRFDLAPSITRIEIEEDSLETVVLGLIKAGEEA